MRYENKRESRVTRPEANAPTAPGYYWAKWRICEDGTADEAVFEPSDRWTVVDVFDEFGSLMVFVPGVELPQSIENFFWAKPVVALTPPDGGRVVMNGASVIPNCRCQVASSEPSPDDQTHGSAQPEIPPDMELEWWPWLADYRAQNARHLLASVARAREAQARQHEEPLQARSPSPSTGTADRSSIPARFRLAFRILLTGKL